MLYWDVLVKSLFGSGNFSSLNYYFAVPLTKSQKQDIIGISFHARSIS